LDGGSRAGARYRHTTVDMAVEPADDQLRSRGILDVDQDVGESRGRTAVS
jgi:hypothetical protein